MLPGYLIILIPYRLTMSLTSILTTNYSLTPDELAHLLTLFATIDTTSLTYWDIVEQANTFIHTMTYSPNLNSTYPID